MSTPGGQPPENTPDPSGQPQGWGQQSPAGVPDPGQQQWSAPQGQPGQFPGQPGQPGQFPGQQPGGAQAFGAPVQPKKRNKLLLIIGAVVAGIVVLVALLSLLGGSNSAEAGDCVNDKPDKIGVVDCADDQAAYTVVGVLEDISQNQLNEPDSCSQWPRAVAIAWEGSDPEDADSDGTGYCLEELTS